jgi:putative DNA primase/helicase
MTAFETGSRFEQARRYFSAGFSVVPIKADASKRPIGRWKCYQSRLPTESELVKLFSSDAVGIAIIAGEVSGGLTVLDFDRHDLYPQWQEVVESLAPGLCALLPTVETPSGGYHVYARCPGHTAGNQKLAETADGKTLAETRAEGGYVLAPGCPLECHPTGKVYRHISGPPIGETPALTPAQLSLLLDAARTFNERVREYGPKPRPSESGHAGGDRPGDDFANRTSWQEILTPHGWEAVYERGGLTYWRRPGKTDPGTSATSGVRPGCDRDLLYVFSTNAVPLEPTRSYGKFAAFAVLNHGGDFKAAARDLGLRGFGVRGRAGSCAKSAEAESGKEDAGEPAEGGPHLTDCGNAIRLVREHGTNLRYCHLWRKWMVWDGQRWKIDDRATVTLLFKQTIGGLFRWAKAKAAEIAKQLEAEHENGQ